MPRRHATAVPSGAPSLAIDPGLAVAAWLRGATCILDHHPSAAAEILDSAISLGRHDVSVHSRRLLARLLLRDTSGARADLDYIGGLLQPSLESDSIADAFYRSMRVLFEARRGDSAGARLQLDSLTAHHPPDELRAGTMIAYVALAYLTVGNANRALELLQRVPRTPELWIGLRNPVWDSVRADPRFHRLEREALALRPTLARRKG